jgi:hypothetical protein
MLRNLKQGSGMPNMLSSSYLQLRLPMNRPVLPIKIIVAAQRAMTGHPLPFSKRQVHTVNAHSITAINTACQPVQAK